MLLIWTATLLSAETRFGGLALSDDNILLFKATTESPVTGTYETLFAADLTEDSIKQLSVFPERLTYLSEVNRLQIQNRFGVFRTEDDRMNVEPVSRFQGFVLGDDIQTGKIAPVTASPDGRYLVFLDQTSYSYATLKLYDVVENREITVSEQVEISFDTSHARWSPDSRFFVYSKQGELYYYSIDQLRNERVLAEELRHIGEGLINSISWNAENNLYYIRNSLVYEITPGEFFTRSIYSDLINIGRIIGKVPFEFKPHFDSFWIGPNGNKILLNKGGRNLFQYNLGTEDYIDTGDTQSFPNLFLPRNTRVKRVLWSKGNIITILTGSIRHGNDDTAVYRFNPQERSGKPVFVKTEDTEVRDIVLSPEGRQVAVVFSDRVEIKEYRSWKDTRQVAHTEPLSVVWATEQELLMAGRYIIERVGIEDSERQLLGFSQIDRYGFSSAEGNIQVKVLDRVYEKTKEDGWVEKRELSIDRHKAYSSLYRVYLEDLPERSYRNIIMVRDQKGYQGTNPLFSPPERMYEPFPEDPDPVEFANFEHGSRLRRREVAIVFNAIGSVEGLTTILNTMADYDMKSTFFINGEFIRRNPGAVKEIAESGHEVGSLFYTYFNMTDARYTVNKEFVKQGLAKNEDDYFRVTGDELSLLWHAPYYFTNSLIVEAADEMNYQYVGRDIDSLDWVTREHGDKYDGFYMRSSELIERIIELKKPGSIISVRVGTPEGERVDYLFKKLDVLLNGLISLGYTVVPVSILIEHAQ